MTGYTIATQDCKDEDHLQGRQNRKVKGALALGFLPLDLLLNDQK